MFFTLVELFITTERGENMSYSKILCDAITKYGVNIHSYVIYI